MIPKHDNSAAVEDDLEKMLKPTGCLELHYKLQECFAETKDWRKCQIAMQDLRKCMEAYKAKQNNVE